MKYKIKGIGNKCPKCKNNMERREHSDEPKNKDYYYTEWDYCKPCGHIQHYPQFQSSKWIKFENKYDKFLRKKGIS